MLSVDQVFGLKKKTKQDSTAVKIQVQVSTSKKTLHVLKSINNFSLDEFTFCGDIGRTQRFAHYTIYSSSH